MENKIEKQSEKEELKFIEKYGLWIIIIALISGLIVLKIILNNYSA